MKEDKNLVTKLRQKLRKKTKSYLDKVLSQLKKKREEKKKKKKELSLNTKRFLFKNIPITNV